MLHMGRPRPAVGAVPSRPKATLRDNLQGVEAFKASKGLLRWQASLPSHPGARPSPWQEVIPSWLRTIVFILEYT